jgi:hypothetical protein
LKQKNEKKTKSEIHLKLVGEFEAEVDHQLFTIYSRVTYRESSVNISSSYHEEDATEYPAYTHV